MRVLSWIVGRCRGTHSHREPLGWMPEFEDMHWQGLEFGAISTPASHIDRSAWERELKLHDELFAKLRTSCRKL